MTSIDKAGSEILVDEGIGGFQIRPDVALLADGRSIVVWQRSSSPAGNLVHILGQLYASDGTAIGSAFELDAAASLKQYAAVTALAGGGFVTTWEDFGVASPRAPDAPDVKAQLFAADGTKVGGEFLVSSKTIAGQGFVDISALSTGGFVSTWSDTGSPNYSPSIRAQIFAEDGTKVGAEFTANAGAAAPSKEASAFFSHFASVAALDDGRFVVTTGTFSRTDSVTATERAVAQIFDGEGRKVGGEILVGDGYSYPPQAANLGNGSFVIAWADGDEIKAQVYDNAGGKVGAELLIANAGAGVGLDLGIGVAAVGQGNFVATWMDASGSLGDTDGTAIAARLFDAAGAALSPIFRVNSDTGDFQRMPKVAGSADGHLLFSWYDGTSLQNTAIKAQAYFVDQDTDGPITFTSDGGGVTAFTTVAENNSAVTTVHATAEDTMAAVSYAIMGGDDAALFVIDTVTGALTFKSAPDFEMPGDVGQDNVYQLIVGAHAGEAAGSQAIVVRVTNVIEATTFRGTNGADVFAAPEAQDYAIFGLAGNDTLKGNSGQDAISGGSGKDIMTGGAGADTFVFALGESKAGGGVRDIITDFTVDVDKLDLTALNITDFAAEVSFKAIGRGMIVYVDTNHNGFDYSDFGVQLAGVSSLTQSDFLL